MVLESSVLVFCQVLRTVNAHYAFPFSASSAASSANLFALKTSGCESDLVFRVRSLLTCNIFIFGAFSSS